MADFIGVLKLIISVYHKDDINIRNTRYVVISKKGSFVKYFCINYCLHPPKSPGYMPLIKIYNTRRRASNNASRIKYISYPSGTTSNLCNKKIIKPVRFNLACLQQLMTGYIYRRSIFGNGPQFFLILALLWYHYQHTY